MSEQENKNTFFSLIPQVFFDFIARILPGPIILTSFLTVFRIKISDLQTFNSYVNNTLPFQGFFLFIIVFFTFYIASVISYGFYSIIRFSICSILFRIKISFMEEFQKAKDAGMFFSVQYDFIKLTNGTAGSRITKLSAEIHMSGSLLSVFIICLLIEIFKPHDYMSIYMIATFSLCAIGSLVSHYHFCKNFNRSVQSNFFLLRSDYITDLNFIDYNCWIKTQTNNFTK